MCTQRQQPTRWLGTIVTVAVLSLHAAAHAGDALPSWKDGKTKGSILAFVERTTRSGPDFIAEPERIATFDNDGTLWAEQPMAFQAYFLFDRIRALGPEHPEWKTREPFASVLRGDFRKAISAGENAVVELAVAVQAGTTVGELERQVVDWIATARHPKTGRLYTDMVYQPMLELMTFLRSNGFKTYIVSGSAIDFIRPWAEKVYGIPPEQVIGSTVKTKFELVGGKPVITRLPAVEFVDDKQGKPIAIHTHIGRRPVLAFGNSDGDMPMLQWTCGSPGPRFCAYLHHTDRKREFSYDRKASFGRLDKGLDQAKRDGWTIIDMKSDWKTVFPSAAR